MIGAPFVDHLASSPPECRLYDGNAVMLGRPGAAVPTQHGGYVGSCINVAELCSGFAVRSSV
jgi:hypothetical protein